MDRLFAIAVLSVLPGQSEEQAPARLVVDFVSAEPGAEWVARALEQNIYKDLSATERIVAVDKGDVARVPCPKRESRCLLEAYGEAGIDIVILGTAKRERLDFEVYETWTDARVGRSSLPLGPEESLIRMRRKTTAAVKPFLQSGGLLEQKRFLTGERREVVPTDEVQRQRAPASGAAQVILILIMCLLAMPLLLLKRVAGDRLATIFRDGPWRWCGLLVVLTALVHVAVAVPPVAELIERIPLDKLPMRGMRWVAPVIGGMAWGWFALLNIRLVLPRLHGIERIRHGHVGALLSAWLQTIALRLSWLLVYVPFGAAVWLACRALDVEPGFAWLVVAPVAGLAAYFWLLSVTDTLAVALDNKLVQGTPDASNPWHAAIKKYFLGYVRRSGLALDKRLLRRLLFLPGETGSGLVAYGAGLAPERIVIGADLLDTALGPLDEDPESPYQAPEQDARWYGTLMPAEVGDTRSRKRARARARQWRRDLKQRRALELRRPIPPRVLGENATLLGWVLPFPSDETVPLIADTRDDFSVVRELLTEHYAAFERDVGDEEYDDTDPTQKDFLFGAILREIGTLLRREGPAQTLAALLRLWLQRVPRWIARLVDWFVERYRRNLSRYPVALADAYAALNLGRDHLIQHLFHLRTGEQERLTARATVPQLYTLANEMLAETAAEEPQGADRFPFRATLRNRLMWLSQFFYTPVHQKAARRLRTLLVALLTVAAITWLGFTVHNAIDYHPIYVERMQQLEKKIEEARQEGSDDVKRN